MASERPTLTWRSPGVPFHVAFGMFVGYTLNASSLPGRVDIFFWQFVWGPAWFAWLVWFLLHSRGGILGARGIDWRGLKPWLVHLIVGGLVVLVVRHDWPLALRFQLSRSHLERDARAVIANPDSAKSEYRKGLWVGLYRVRRSVEDGVVYYKVDGAGGIFGWGGFAYAPGSPPKEGPWELGGGWSVWLRST